MGVQASFGSREVGMGGIAPAARYARESFMTEMQASDGGTLACSCGLTFATADELDEHFYDVFVPADDTGLDGKRHAEIDPG